MINKPSKHPHLWNFIDSPSSKSIPIINNFTIKIFYIGMLYSWTIPEIRKFFAALPPLEIEGKIYDECEMFRHFWDARRWIPVSYMAQVARFLEPFLVEKGSSLEMFFVEPAVQRISFEPQEYLFLLSPFLRLFSKESDFSTAMLKIFPVVSNMMYNRSYARLEKLIRENGIIRARYVFTYDRYFMSDFTVEDFEGHMWFNKCLPLIVGEEPYHDLHVLIEACSVTELAGLYCSTKIEEEIFYINGERYGYTESFLAFCSRLDLNFGKLNPPDSTVIVAEKDYYCPVRKRVVIRKSVAYNAPIVVHEIIHVPKRNRVNPMQSLATYNLQDYKQKFAPIEAKHFHLLRECQGSICISFDSSKLILFLNGKYFCSGVQAKMVWEIMCLVVNEGRQSLTRRELMEYPGFVIDKFSTGLSTRLNRSFELIRSMCPGFSITRESRGVFRIKVDANIELTRY